MSATWWKTNTFQMKWYDYISSRESLSRYVSITLVLCIFWSITSEIIDGNGTFHASKFTIMFFRRANGGFWLVWKRINMNNGEGTHLASKVLIAHQKVILITFKRRFFLLFVKFSTVLYWCIKQQVFYIFYIYMNYTNDDCWIKVTSFPPWIKHLLSFSWMQIILFLRYIEMNGYKR